MEPHHVLKTRFEKTHDVDEDGGEDGARDGFAVGRVVGAAHELLVVGAEEQGEDAEDDDCEEGDDGAARNHETMVSLDLSPNKPLAISQVLFRERRKRHAEGCF